MWVETEVRRLTGWVAPTCRIVCVLTLKALSLSIGARSRTTVGPYVLRAYQSKRTALYLVGSGQGRAVSMLRGCV